MAFAMLAFLGGCNGETVETAGGEVGGTPVAASGGADAGNLDDLQRRALELTADRQNWTDTHEVVYQDGLAMWDANPEDLGPMLVILPLVRSNMALSVDEKGDRIEQDMLPRAESISNGQIRDSALQQLNAQLEGFRS